MLLSSIAQQGWTARHIVITGGEPAIYDLRPLTDALEAAGFQCQIRKPAGPTKSTALHKPG